MKKLLLICIICLTFLVSGCGRKISFYDFTRVALSGTPQEIEKAIISYGDINKSATINTKIGPIKIYPIFSVVQSTKYPEAIEIMVKHGADLNVKTGTADTEIRPLDHAAVENPNKGIVTALYKNGAKTIMNDDRYLIYDAIGNSNPEILEEVLQIDEVRNAALNSSVRNTAVNYAKKSKSSPEEKLRILYKYGFSD